MSEWISVKDRLPEDDTFVRVKMCILYTEEKECLYLKKYFIRKGENITKWVTHWKPSKLPIPFKKISLEEFKNLYPSVKKTGST